MVLILLRKVRNCQKSGVAITTDAKVWKNEIGCKYPQHVTDRKRGTRESTQPVRDGSAGKPAENYGNIPPLWAGVMPRVVLAADGVNRRETLIADGREAAACMLRVVAQEYAFIRRHCVTCVTQSGQFFVPARQAPSGGRALGEMPSKRHGNACGVRRRVATEKGERSGRVSSGRGQRISARRCKP